MTEKKTAQNPALQQAAVTEPVVIRRLGNRLRHLYQWTLAAEPYDDIWDVCCDHGHLGLHLHRALRQPVLGPRSHVHLVDCVPNIINALKSQYAPLMDSQLSVHCLDAGAIPLRQGRQLVLVAGIGVGTMVTILEKITQQIHEAQVQDSQMHLEFMLSPNLNVLELRHFLRQHPFELLREAFVTDKGRHHEHLHLRYHTSTRDIEKPTPIGKSLWSPLTKEKEDYLKSLIAHYQSRVRMGGDTGARGAVEAYSKVLNSLG